MGRPPTDRWRWLAAALLLVASAPAAAAGAASLPRDLARKVADAYGGPAALARVRCVRQRGAVAALAQGGKVGDLERVLAMPDSLRVEIAYPGEPHEVRSSHAGKGTRDGRDVTGTIPHFAMILQAARLALPFWIAAGDPRIRDGGVVERESRSLRSVVVELERSLVLVGEIDPASGRIVRTIGRIPGPGGQPLDFVNTYSDFRKVGGVTFAFREENFAQGVHTGDTVLQRIEILPDVPPGLFDGGKRSDAPAGQQL